MNNDSDVDNTSFFFHRYSVLNALILVRERIGASLGYTVGYSKYGLFAATFIEVFYRIHTKS